MIDKASLICQIVSTGFTAILTVTFFNVLSGIASLLAIAWWITQFYRRYKRNKRNNPK